MPVYLLPEDEIVFPPPQLANEDGVLAVGGDLSTDRLLMAYRSGIFPWFNPGDPIVWWSPDPRFVLFPDELKIARSMRPYLNQRKLSVTFDQAFEQVIRACQVRASEAARRGKYIGTWITDEMVQSYTSLHEQGYAHSVEMWQQDQLVGGLYGISLGRVFFGESMFTRVSNASKLALISLVQHLRPQGFTLIDCQQETQHLASMGARNISREDFLAHLQLNQQIPSLRGNWGTLLKNS